MRTVIKKHQSKFFILSLSLVLSACATYRDIPENSSLQDVEKVIGQANVRCPLDDGSTRLVWNHQPYGQYGYAATLNKQGTVDQVKSIMNEAYYKRLNQGSWDKEAIYCEFGSPAEVSRVGLGEKKEEVWSYRYKQNNIWNQLLHIYMGPNGEQFTHYHTGPDPLFDRDEFMGFAW